MAKVDINIIKEWFRNFKKPNQDQFWAWLDSFRHKDDKIPMADVENLNSTLSKKADLVNGLVPESQLPFTINSNEVIEIGLIETTINNVKINVHQSGSNKVRIGGQILTRNFPNNLSFLPVNNGNRFLRIVARNETGLFFLRQSAESDEPQEPALEPGDVHVRLILVTPTGSHVDPEVLSGFMEKEEENWKEVLLGSSSNFTLNYSDKRTRFKVNAINDVPKTLNAIVFAKETDRAVEFWIYNGMNLNINIPIAETNGLSKGFSVSSSPFSILPKSYGVLKYNPQTNLIECWRVNASGSSVLTDGTLKGSGITGNVLGLSESKNAEIAGKLDKTSTTAQQVASAVGLGVAPSEKFEVVGRMKANSVVFANEIGTAIPWEFGRQFNELIVADGSGVPMKILFLGKTFEHQIRGKKVNLNIAVSGTLNIDLNTGSHFSINSTGVSGTINVVFTNMPGADETCSITMTVIGSLLTLPSWLAADKYNDIPEVGKKREYNVVIKNGGISPEGRFTVQNI